MFFPIASDSLGLCLAPAEGECIPEDAQLLYIVLYAKLHSFTE